MPASLEPSIKPTTTLIDDKANPKPMYRRSAISDTFEGALCTTVVCASCGHRSQTIEHFYDLSLPLPSKKQQLEEEERTDMVTSKLAQVTQPNTPSSGAGL